MIPINITASDKLGVIYIRLKESLDEDIDRYFKGVNNIQNLHRSNILLSSIKGYYLSLWNGGGIRFSYFTDNHNDSEEFLIEKFTSIGLEKYLESKNPHNETFNYYHGKSKSNLDFRRFLLLITNIGFDLLQYDINYCRCLAAKYRLDIAPSGISSKTYFESAFNKISYYNSLPSELRDELFDGLDYWHSSWEDWAHMLVVMLLPGDWIYSNHCRSVFDPRRPIDKILRDKLARNLLPNDWQP